MIGKDELISFKKMWTWLSGYPAHDREYYMKYVAKLDTFWTQSCPLANKSDATCDGCSLLWQGKDGTLCTDPASPLFRWQQTETDRPDDRSFYASQVAVIAMNVLRDIEREPEKYQIFGPDYIHSQLHG